MKLVKNQNSKVKKQETTVPAQEPIVPTIDQNANAPIVPTIDPNAPIEIAMSQNILDAIKRKQTEIGEETKDAQKAIPELQKALSKVAQTAKQAVDNDAKVELEYFKSFAKYWQSKATVQQTQNDNFLADYQIEQQEKEVNDGNMFTLGYIQAMKDAAVINQGIDLANVKNVVMKSGVLTVALKEVAVPAENK